VRGLTREVAALGIHTKHRFDALTIFGKLLTSLILMAVGGALALGGYVLKRPSADSIRQQIRIHTATQNWLAAKEDLERLRTVQERLTEEDRFTLAAPVQAGLQKVAAALFDDVAAARRVKKWDDALAKVDELERLGIETRRTVFTHAEILRFAGRPAEAARQYARYVRLFPDTEETDDALFWHALILKDQGDIKGARALLEQIVVKFPGSNFLTSTKRILEDMGR
jgi:tetratricopeptide (TPR) repeat protein